MHPGGTQQGNKTATRRADAFAIPNQVRDDGGCVGDGVMGIGRI